MFTANSSAATAAHEKWLQANKDPSRRCHSIQELSTTLTTHQKNKRVWMDSGVHFEHLWKQGVCHISRHLEDIKMLYVAPEFSKENYGFSYTPWERNFLSTHFNFSNPAGLDLLEFFRGIGREETEYVLETERFLRSMEWEDERRRDIIKREFRNTDDLDLKHAVGVLKYNRDWSGFVKDFIAEENKKYLKQGLERQQFWRNMKEKREEEERRKKRRLKEAQALEEEDTLKLNEFLKCACKEKKGEKRKRDPPQTEEEPHKKVCEEDLISWSSSEESGFLSEDSFMCV